MAGKAMPFGKALAGGLPVCGMSGLGCNSAGSPRLHLFAASVPALPSPAGYIRRIGYSKDVNALLAFAMD